MKQKTTRFMQCVSITFFAVNSFACSRAAPVEQGVVETVYVHKYGPKIATEEDWKERGATGQIIKRQKDGVLVTQNWKDGALDGLVEYTFANASTISKQQFYEHDVLLWEMAYYTSGMPRFKITHTPPNQRFVSSWYEDGLPRAKEHFVGRSLMQGEYFLPNQERESEICDGHGIRMLRDGSGQLDMRQVMQAGELASKELFYPNNMLKVSIPYRADKVHGLKKTFLVSGEPATIEEWFQGRQHGMTKVFQNGVVIAEVPYRNGHKDGIELRYNESTGKIMQRVSWKEGELHGLTKIFLDNKEVDEWYFNGRRSTKYEFHTRLRDHGIRPE